MNKALVFGIIAFFVILNSAYSEGDFPDVFVTSGKFNGVIVVGEKASASDVIAQSNMVQYFISYTGTTAKGTTKLSNEISGLEDNIISIGSPCVNPVSAAILGNPKPCDKAIDSSKPTVKLFKADGFYHLVIAGYTDAQTRQAVTDVINGKIDVDIESTSDEAQIMPIEKTAEQAAVQNTSQAAAISQADAEAGKTNIAEELNKKIQNKASEIIKEPEQEKKTNISEKQEIKATEKEDKEAKKEKKEPVIKRIFGWLKRLFGK